MCGRFRRHQRNRPIIRRLDPVELPARLIELYTYSGDVVLDPFLGAGTTAVAAAKANRHYIGYEISTEYVEVAAARLSRGTWGLTESH